MSFIVLRKYTTVKSKPINELENLPQAEIVKYFCRFYLTDYSWKIQTSNFTNQCTFL